MTLVETTIALSILKLLKIYLFIKNFKLFIIIKKNYEFIKKNYYQFIKNFKDILFYPEKLGSMRGGKSDNNLLTKTPP